MLTPTSLAAWWFEPVRLEGTDRLVRYLRAAELAVGVLRSARLLTPERLEIPSATMPGVRLPAVELSLDGAFDLAELHARVGLAITDLRDLGDRYPPFMYVFGQGTVDLPDGTTREEELLSISVAPADGLSVGLATRSDVWLPFDLHARPQQQLADRNAARLEHALQELGVLLGVPPWPGGVTKYAVTEGLRPENHRDIDGDVLPVAPPAGIEE